MQLDFQKKFDEVFNEFAKEVADSNISQKELEGLPYDTLWELLSNTGQLSKQDDAPQYAEELEQMARRIADVLSSRPESSRPEFEYDDTLRREGNNRRLANRQRNQEGRN